MKKIVLVLITTILLTGCNDWLAVNPRTEKPAAEMFEDYKGFRDALSGCYVAMRERNVYGEHLTMTMIESMAQLWMTDGYNTPLAYEIKDFDYEDDRVKSAVRNAYAGLYNIVVQANTVLEAIEEYGNNIPDETTRKVLEGEALAMRAFCHFDVLRLFGQMPQGGTKKISLPYSHKVSKEVVTYYTYENFVLEIEKDLTAAEKALKDNDPLFSESFEKLSAISYGGDEYMTYRQFRFNYYAVKALQARFYLYTQQPTKAYAAAKAVIDAKDPYGNAVRTIANAQNDYDRAGYAFPSEWFVALTHSGMQNYVQSVLNGAVGMGTNSNHLYISTADLSDMFGGKHGIDYSASNRKKTFWETTNIGHGGDYSPTIRKYYREPNLDNMTSSTPYAKIYQAIPLLRMSEIYLIAIETTESNAEANALYKEYLQAQDINTNSVELIFNPGDDIGEMLLDDYRREFYAEGQMFFAYKRLNMSHMTTLHEAGSPYSRTVTETEFIVPVPDTEINPNL